MLYLEADNDFPIEPLLVENVDKTTICELQLDAAKAAQFRDAIINSYWFEFFIGKFLVMFPVLSKLQYVWLRSLYVKIQAFLFFPPVVFLYLSFLYI